MRDLIDLEAVRESGENACHISGVSGN